MKYPMRKFLISALFAAATFASQAATLDKATVSSGNDSGMLAHPVGRWVGADELDIRFLIALPEFTEIDAKSMRFEISGTTIALYYGLSEIPHTLDQPVPACQVTKTLTYTIKGVEKHSYQVKIVGDTAGPVANLPVIPLGPHGQQRYALKLRTYKEGTLELDGKPITQTALEKTFKDDVTYQLPVWFHPESYNPQKWLDLAIEDQLPFDFAKKADFSDLVEKSKNR
jgi:hypothetical protein